MERFLPDWQTVAKCPFFFITFVVLSVNRGHNSLKFMSFSTEYASGARSLFILCVAGFTWLPVWPYKALNIPLEWNGGMEYWNDHELGRKYNCFLFRRTQSLIRPVTINTSHICAHYPWLVVIRAETMMDF